MRSRVTTGDILTEIRSLRDSTDRSIASLRDSTDRSIASLRASTEAGLTGVHQRIDTLIDSVADLRADFERHVQGG